MNNLNICQINPRTICIFFYIISPGVILIIYQPNDREALRTRFKFYIILNLFKFFPEFIAFSKIVPGLARFINLQSTIPSTITSNTSMLFLIGRYYLRSSSLSNTSLM